VLAEETGISDVTLYHWRKQAKAGGMVVPGDGKNSENWSPEDKFAMVLATRNDQTIREAAARHESMVNCSSSVSIFLKLLYQSTCFVTGSRPHRPGGHFSKTTLTV
jgi:hypothetical protein